MKKMRHITWLAILVVALSALCLPALALAADGASDNTTPVVVTTTEPTPEPEPADSMKLTTEFPTLEAVAAGTFQFNVTLDYSGKENRVFDLKTSAPSGWDVYLQPQYESGKRISSISIDSSFSGMSKAITVVVSSPVYPPPDPGEYKVLFTAVSKDVSGSIELAAKITAKYAINAEPSNQRYDTRATAGKSNVFSIQLINLGSAPIDNVTFNSVHPDGWEIKFTPEKLDQLPTGDLKPVDVNIKPPPKTVAGYYKITVNVAGKQATADKMDIMVEVKTPTIWGWVGVIIIVIVVGGLFVIFMRFGRR